MSAGWYTDAVRARAKSPACDSDGFRTRLRTACTVFPRDSASRRHGEPQQFSALRGLPSLAERDEVGQRAERGCPRIAKDSHLPPYLIVLVGRSCCR